MSALDYILLGTETAIGCTYSMASHFISSGAASTAQSILSKYYSVGPASVIFLAVDIARDPEHWAGACSGFVAGLVAGAKIGAAVGGLAGAVVGAIAGGIINFCVTQFVNKMQDDYMTGSGIFAPSSPGGGGGPGGVEFRLVSALNGFKEANVVLLRKCNIFFETDDEKLTREAFNSLCVPMFQNRKIQEYFETIVAEIFNGKLNNESLPFVSLHFNRNGLLYSVMNPLYKKTIVGNTLAFLDFFLKGFVNGGFFDIQFVKNWKSNSITDLNELNKHLIDIRKLLKKIKPGYRSLYSLLDQDSYGDEFSSAFRIIGFISSTCPMSGNNMLPNSKFTVETDIFPNPIFERIIAENEKAQDKWKQINNAHIRMKYIIKNYMPLVPQFKGYFQILNMICFALHYVESLDSVGLRAETKSSFKNQDNPYVEIIPEFFPPLPVRKSFKIDPKMTFGDFIKSFADSPFDDELFNLIEGNLDEFSQECTKILVTKLCNLYKEKIMSQATSQNLQNYIHDDDDIELDVFHMISMRFVEQSQILIPNMISRLYSQLIKTAEELINENNISLNDDAKKDFDIDNLNLTIPQLRDRLNRISDSLKNLTNINKLKDDVDYICHHFAHFDASNICYDFFEKFFNHQINFTLAISTPVIVNDANMSIRGGCLVHTRQSCTIINQELPISDINAIERSVDRKDDYISVQGKMGFLTSFNLIPYRYEPIKFDRDAFNEDFKTLLKNNGLTMKHLCLMNGVVDKSFSDLPLNKLNDKTENNVYAIDMPCVNGNILAIDYFIKKGQDFCQTQYNGLYPFLEIVQNGNHQAALHILSNPAAKLSNINQSTETGLTPLHWAVYYGWDDVTKELISRNASTDVTLRRNGMTPVHLACFHDQPQCLSILMDAPNVKYEYSIAGYTPFHIAAEHSLSCTKMLIDKGVFDPMQVDPFKHTSRDIAILNGQYDIAKMIPETTQTIKFFDNFQIQTESKSFDFSSLLDAFSSGDLSTTKRMLIKFNEQNKDKKIKPELYEKIIECACEGCCTEYVELLSKLIPLDKYPIAIKTAQFGIINWLNELKKYGADFSVNNYGFFDEAIINGDDEFLKEALNIVEKIPEVVWKRIVNRSVMIGDEKVMNVLKNYLSSNEKYSNIRLSAEDVITPKTNLASFLNFVEFITPESLEILTNFIDFISLSFLQDLIRYKSFNIIQLKCSVIRACNKKRFDVAYAIIREFPAIKSLDIWTNPIVNKLTNENFIIARNHIGNLLIKDESNVQALKSIFSQTFDIGMLKIHDDKSLLEIAGTSYEYLWILNALPDDYVREFCFDENYSFQLQCSSTFTIVFNIFKKRFDREAGSLFLKSFKKLDLDGLDNGGFGDILVSNLIKVMIENNRNQSSYIKSIDDERQTLFHIAARFSQISKSVLDTLMTNIEKASRSWDNLLNSKTRKGETILMIFASKGNFEAIKKLQNIGINIKTRDTHGNNILHKILKDKSKKNNQFIEGIVEISKKHRELIIQYNRKGQNVFHIAAKRGLNGVLGVLSLFYPVEVLDNLNENYTKSAIHIAAKKNYYETVRYLVQNLHIDLNVRTFDEANIAPIHIAAMTSSLETFKEIIKLGGNPLIEDAFGNNAFYYAFAYGSDFMVSQMMNIQSFIFELSSPSILIPIVQNKQAASSFQLICHLIDPSATRKCDERGMTLLSIAAQYDNRKIVNDLLLMGVDPSIPANNGKNSIHICAENNRIGCSTLILKYLLLTKGIDEINKILNYPDKNGNLPIHIAASKGYSGFVAHLLSVSNEISVDKDNYDGNNPAHLAHKNGHIKVAAIIENYWIKNSFGVGLSELPSSLPFYVSKVFADAWKINEEINKATHEYDKIETIELMNHYIDESIPNTFIKEMENRGISISTDLQSKFYRAFNSGIFDTKLLTLVSDGHAEIVKVMLDIMNIQKPNRINLILYLMILPRISVDELGSFIECVTILNGIKVSSRHPLFAWIENGLVSATELRNISMPIMPSVRIVIEFASRIFEHSRLRKIIKYPRLPLPVHIVANWLMGFNNSWLKVQLQFMDYTKITAFYESKQMLAVDFCNRLDYKQYDLVNFIMDRNNAKLNHSIKFKEYVVYAIKATFEIYNDPEIQDDVRQNLINKCIQLAKKEQFSPKSLTRWSLLTRRIIKDFDIDYLNEYFKVIPQTSLDVANHALSLILNIGSPDQVSNSLIRKGIKKLEEKAQNVEKTKFVETRSLDEILSTFCKKDAPFIPYKFAFDGTPIFELSQEDRNNLRIFGSIVESGAQIVGTLEEAAKEAGIKFKKMPTVENAANLVAIVRFAIQDTLKLKPFIIQCLAVGALLLHRVNNSPGLKGRIAQIATGEGKSIIVAMLAASVALTGSFVDVISSSFYLAKRDAEKFDEFYDKLGLSCGTLNEDDQIPNVDFHIIYSTNTGFEFAFLREGISGQKTLMAIPLYSNITKRRNPMTAIVDEADNLFIDTVKNSARIASGSSSQQKWIFAPLYKEVNSRLFMTIFDARQFLNSIATTQNEKDSIKDISDYQLRRLIENARVAKNLLKKDIHYIVGFNQEEKKYEIQIVDHENTGRINFGSRWSEGLHEFVEVKEGLQVRSQSLTIAAVSHPSFFGRYIEIYGLTGTLGDKTERDEIEKMYGLDTFDVPPNRKCLRKRIETLIVPTDEQKHEIIINKIREITANQRPILVIVKSIEESLQLSNKLKIQRIRHYLLNDAQDEDEDFIVDRAGNCGAVTIATNTAGRGTDIRLEKMAIENGGLHVILAFLPINMRVECQGLGRAGRQGQPGSCQIIFSDRKYAKQNPVATDDVMEAVYKKLSEDVATESNNRIMHTQREQRIFGILTKYFDYIANIRQFLEGPQGEQLLNAFGGENLNNQFDSESILNDLSFKWSKFYTHLSNKDIIVNDNMFEEFKEKYEDENKVLGLAFNDYLENLHDGNSICSSSIDDSSIESNSISSSIDYNSRSSSKEGYNFRNKIEEFSGSKPIHKI